MTVFLDWLIFQYNLTRLKLVFSPQAARRIKCKFALAAASLIGLIALADLARAAHV